MPESLVTLVELVAEGFGDSVHGPANLQTLAAQLDARGIDIVLDDIGRRAITRQAARALFTERAEQQAAARERAAAAAVGRASQLSYADAIRRGIAARVARQRELLREYPNMPAHEVMALSNGSADRKLAAAGRRFDSYVNAANNGVDGYGRSGRIPSGS
jgi:hypothetical protein